MINTKLLRKIRIASFLLIAIGVIFLLYYLTIHRNSIDRIDNTKQENGNSNMNWHIFRGNPQLDGSISADLPEKIVLSWSIQIGETIKSSPVIHENIIFVGSDTGFFYALDLGTGKKLWKFEGDGSIEAPPLYADGSIFVSSTKGTLFSLNSDTGILNWKYKTGDRIVGSANLIEIGGKLRIIVGSHDNYLYSFDLKSGNVIWKYE